MQKTLVYALDFDGVICDSVIEITFAAWKAAQSLWDDMQDIALSEATIQQFRQVRPQLEIGYEAILIVRLLHIGQSVEHVCQNYASETQALIKSHHLNIAELKSALTQTRNEWLKTDQADWLAKNPLFDHIADSLRYLVNCSEHICYIVTTKSEKFVYEILNAKDIYLEDEFVFGLDQPLNKQQVLQKLSKKHLDSNIIFVEDRLETLLNILDNTHLSHIDLQLATWGYNTQDCHKIAKDKQIECIDLPTFNQMLTS
jgi:phosphoglycolate phosphatase-like HAD superfamily hydrolase